MSKGQTKLIFCLGLLLYGTANAQEADVQAAVTVSIEQDQDIWAGQQVTVNLDLKTTGYSFSNTHFNLPDISGAFLMQTDTTTIKLSEKKEDKDWQVLRYPLALYPLNSGELVLPPINVRFVTSAGFGSEEKSFEFTTEPLELSISLPPGVQQGELIVTTTDFQLTHSWQPDTAIAKTGDAFTLTVERRASDISAMLLPPLPVYQNEGLASYPQTPEIEDKTDRGDLMGERTDSIIWVIEKAGSYSIPGIRFQWWDPVRQELKQQIVPGMNLDVVATQKAGNVAISNQVVESKSRSLVLWFALFIAVLISFGIGFRYSRARSTGNTVTEKSAYVKLQKACKDHQANKTHSAIYDWLSLCPPIPGTSSSALTLNKFGQFINDEQLTRELEKLQFAVVSSTADWNGLALSRAIKDARHRFKAQKAVQSRVNLSPLNP